MSSSQPSTPPSNNKNNQTQMTAARARTEDDKWTCLVCTYQNFPVSKKCTMCLSPAPTVEGNIDTRPTPPRSPDHLGNAAAIDTESPVEESDAAAAASAVTVVAVTERLRPLRIASPKIGHKWACHTCTYENWPKAQKCAMCGAPPPSSPDQAPVVAYPDTNTNANANRHHSYNNAATGEVDGAGARSPVEHRKQRRVHADWVWLQACLGVVEGSMLAVETYLSSGGDPARALTPSEVALLHRPSAFDAGHTLVHLAIRFQRTEMLSLVLSRISGGGSGLKRSPSFAAPDVAAALRRHAAAVLRPRAHRAPTPYLADQPTFSLPPEIEELPAAIQEQLFSELLDRDAQQQLEADPPCINWSHELTERLGSRLHALWNRSLGDCLPDATCQALYGVFDRGGLFRRALSETLSVAGRALFARWAAWERLQAAQAHYCPDDDQLRAEWSRLTAAAGRQGAPLAQLHVFALAQVVRRPIIVYGVRLVRSFRGEPLGFARFQGLYLPLLWQPEQCYKTPIVLGYSRGHFSALAALEPPARRYICAEDSRCVFLPLVDARGEPLDVPFAEHDEPTAATDARAYLHVTTVAGTVCATQSLKERPLLVAQMLEEWLNHYRRVAQQTRGPFPPRLAAARAGYCSDADTDDE